MKRLLAASLAMNCAAVGAIAFACPAQGDDEKRAPNPAPAPVAAAPDGPKTTTARYAVELRQKVNTCGPIDAQVAFDTFAVWRTGDAAMIVAGTDRVFVVRADDDPAGVALNGKIVEPDPAKAAGRAVVCKKNTVVDLEMKDGSLTGTYTRENAQDCIAKGCAVTFQVDGKKL